MSRLFFYNIVLLFFTVNALAYAKLGITSSENELSEFCAAIALYNTAANARFGK